MNTQLATVLLVLVAIAGCGPRRPVLYPNEHYKAVGEAAAQEDIDVCQQMAERMGIQPTQGREVAKSTAEGAAVGTATGAVVGAIGGNAGWGAMIGGAGSATAGFVRGLFTASEPDPLYMRFVDQCLWEKGYQPIGWK